MSEPMVPMAGTMDTASAFCVSGELLSAAHDSQIGPQGTAPMKPRKHAA